MNRMTKQVLVVRKDLNMRKGKIGAQCAHAAMKVLLDQATFVDSKMALEMDEPTSVWLSGKFTKICVSVNSEDELDAIYNAAIAAGIKCSLVVDAGLTEFNGVPTKTVVAIGPDFVDLIDPITSHLSLL